MASMIKVMMVSYIKDTLPFLKKLPPFPIDEASDDGGYKGYAGDGCVEIIASAALEKIRETPDLCKAFLAKARTVGRADAPWHDPEGIISTEPVLEEYFY